MVPNEIWIALSLVLVFEGTLLFAAPAAWQRMARQLSEAEPRTIRIVGAVFLVLGITSLQFFV